MAKALSMVLGIVLLAVGVLGLVSGGHDHTLIIFGINMAHNVVHLLTGAAGLLAAMGGERYAKSYLVVFGAIYALVAVAGFLHVGFATSLLNLNMADNLLHLVIAGACLAVGLQAKAA